MFDSRLKNPQTDILAHAFLSLQNEEECYRLFEDLFTIREVQDLSSAAWRSRMMLAGKGDVYRDRSEKTGAAHRDDRPREPRAELRRGRLRARA